MSLTWTFHIRSKPFDINHKIFTFSAIREFLHRNDVFIRLSCSDTDRSLCNSILILYIIFMTCILNVSFSYSVLLRFMTENVQHFMSRYKYIIQNRLLCHHTICQQLVYNIFHETWIFVYLCKRLVLRPIELSPGYRFYLSDNIDPKTNAGMRLRPCPGLATWRMLLASVHVESGWPRYSCPLPTVSACVKLGLATTGHRGWATEDWWDDGHESGRGCDCGSRS